MPPGRPGELNPVKAICDVRVRAPARAALLPTRKRRARALIATAAETERARGGLAVVGRLENAERSDPAVDAAPPRACACVRPPAVPCQWVDSTVRRELGRSRKLNFIIFTFLT